MMLKGTRTAMSYVAEGRRLAVAHPYPDTGQPGYTPLSDVLSRAVLFANLDVVGAGALVRSGPAVRIVEVGLSPGFRADEYARRLTWRLLADAAHELDGVNEIEDAFGNPLDVTRFVARRRAARTFDRAEPPTPIGRIAIPLPPGSRRRPVLVPARAVKRMPRGPKGHSL